MSSDFKAAQQIWRAYLNQLAALTAVIVLAWIFTRAVLYPALNVPENAPAILRPTAGFFCAWFLLRHSGQKWSELGLVSPACLPLALAGCMLLWAALQATSAFIVPALAGWLKFSPAASFLGYIKGNLVAAIGWLVIAWVVGGLMEELLFRGFMMNRIAAMFSCRWLGASIAVAGQAVFFGLLHLYQGAFGFAFATVFAAIFGIAYYLGRRNLWPLIVVHGAWNSVAIVNIYRPNA